MPSPFPGMDPFLENPAAWTRVHHRIIVRMAYDLNAVVSPRYVADFGERLYGVQSEREILPDLALTEPLSPGAAPQRSAAAVAEARVSDSPWVVTVRRSEMRETFIEIMDLEGESRVVAAIEVLSPSNKAAGSEGRALYLQNQRELLARPIHLVEIDLLRRGEHTLAPPCAKMERRGRWDYAVSLHRGGQGGGRFEIWPILLRDRLPSIRVPLCEGDPDAVLDLQAVLDRGYDEAAWGRRVDYGKDPAPPLSPPDSAWADTILREKGLR